MTALSERLSNLKESFLLMRVLLAFAGVVGALSIYLATSAEMAAEIVRYGGYWFVLAAFAGLVAYGVYLLREEGSRFLSVLRRLGGPFVIFFLVCLGLCFVHADFGPKVMMDDAILISTAKNLHQTREVFTPTFGRWVYNDFSHFDGYVDKRPLLYPFAVSLLHDLSGYRAANPYILNALCGVLLLGGFSLLGYLSSGRKGAYLMPLLWMSIPLFAQNATGGGMDLINLVMIVGVILLSVLYWRRLDSRSEGALALAGVLLAQGRYESPLFLLPVAMVIIIGWLRAGRVIVSAGTILAAPLLLGLLLQNKFFAQSEALWELHSGAETPFALANAPENLLRALHFYFNMGDAYANSLWVAVLGFPALVFFAIYLLREWRKLSVVRPAHIIIGLFGFFLFVHMAVIVCYHDGKLDRLFASRFALPFYLLLTASIVVVLEGFSRKATIWRAAGVGTLLFVVSFTLPMNAKGVFTRRNYVANEIAWMQSVADREFEPRCLVIDIYTIPWTIREVSSLSPLQAYANAVRIDEDLQSGKFSAMYLIERREFTIEGNASHVLPSKFPAGVFAVELMAEHSFQPFKLTRIYRVTGVDRAAAERLLQSP
jgi:hypothetical protein